MGEQGIRESSISYLPLTAVLQNFDFIFVFMWVHICVLLFGGWKSTSGVIPEESPIKFLR